MSGSLGICWNGKRKVISVTPTMMMSKILEDACSFYKIDPALCILKKGKSVIDLSGPFRFSNLPSNSSLDIEMSQPRTGAVSKDAKTKVILNAEGTGSVTGVLSAESTLFQVIEHFVNDNKLPNEALEVETNNLELIYLQSKFIGTTQLTSTTLTGLGLANKAARLQIKFQVVAVAADANSMSLVSASASTATKPALASASSSAAAPMEVVQEQTPSSVFSNIDTINNIITNTNTNTNTNTIASIGNGNGANELKALMTEHFDAVSIPCIITLCKYLFNIYLSPLESKYRIIYTDNRIFQEKVSKCPSAIKFLTSIGFVHSNGGMVRESLQLPIRVQPSSVSSSSSSSSFSSGGENFTEADEEQEALFLQPVVSQLKSALNELNVPIEDQPKLVNRTELLAQRRQQQQQQQQLQQTQVQIPSFDPYKTYVRRVADVNPDGSMAMMNSIGSGSSRSSSSTESRLEALKKRRDEIMGSPLDVDAINEPTQVVLPMDETTKSQQKSKMNITNDYDDDDDDDDAISSKGDGKLLAGALANTLRKLANGEDNTPLTTKALRAIDKAKNELVYNRTLIKIRFSDRIELQRMFHPKTTIGELYSWVQSCLSDDMQPASSSSASSSSSSSNANGSANGNVYKFELFTTPPKEILKVNDKMNSSKTLLQLQYFPTQLIHLKWLGSGLGLELPKDSNIFPGNYIKSELLTGAISGSSLPLPVGVPLVPRSGTGTVTNVKSIAGSSSSSSVGAVASSKSTEGSSTCEAPEKKSKKNGPAWFKL
jgi:hypothetical protein